MSQTEINQHMLNFTYVVMDALDITSVLQNKKRPFKTNIDFADNDEIVNDPILGCLLLTTKEQYFDLEEKLKNDSFVKSWKMSLLEHTKALSFTTFATTTAAKMMMKEIFSQDMFKKICYAGNKTSGEKKVAVKNGSVYFTLISNCVKTSGLQRRCKD
ncbi:uncharacterized protein LOC136073132 [Hydra vulgaris]|uniref:uncharacterized protein LOC136073132 n=1 Tax=Hydra vulgaris TaxID=6087 RepID=UPI0032EA1809